MTPKLPPDNVRGPVQLGRRDLAALCAFSTAAVCDAIAELAPERRPFGFTTEPLFAARPQLGPVVGYACTAAVRTSASPSLLADDKQASTLGWLEHLSGAPKPAVAVVQDLDGGRTACCDRLLAHMHAALGCEGLITDGAVRDLDRLPEAFGVLAAAVRPSRGRLRWVVKGATVNVAGLAVSDGDIVHADANGAVVIPADLVRDIPAAVEHARAHDAEMLDACRRPGVGFAALRPLLLGHRQTRWCS